MAMKGVNEVTILGRIGNEIKLSKTHSDTPVLNLSVATTETWKDRDSDKEREETEWHRVVLFRKLAEVAAKYCAKGGQIFIQGKLKTRSWEDKESGVTRYSTEIIATNLQLIGGAKSESDDSSVDVPPR